MINSLSWCTALYHIHRSSHRDSFPKYLFFFSRSNLFTILQEVLSVLRTDTNFSGGFIETDMFFQGGSICSSIRPYYFIEQILETLIQLPRTHTRSLYFLIEQIFIFQEALSTHQTHIIFQETPIPRTDRHFPGRYHPSNRYFVI